MVYVRYLYLCYLLFFSITEWICCNNFSHVRLFEGQVMGSPRLDLCSCPMTDRCDKDSHKSMDVFCCLSSVLWLFLLLMCQFSEKKKRPFAEESPLSILFRFCDIVQECINKILCLTFLFPAIGFFIVVPLCSSPPSPPSTAIRSQRAWCMPGNQNHLSHF